MIKVEPLIEEAGFYRHFQVHREFRLELGWGVVEGPTAAATSSATIISRTF